MKKLFALLSTLAVLPVYAAEYAQPAAAQSGANPPAASQPATQPAVPAQPKSTGTVARAQFTNAIQDREPVDKVSNLLNDKNRVYFFSEIKDAPNQKITHRWEHDGKVVSETSFDIGGNRWRVYSNKTLDPQQTGEWKVSVVDEAGSTLGVSTFTYEAAPAAASQPAAAQPAAAPTAAPAQQ
ncbi:MAG TPA: DUF2914 domain-containing protein [Acidiferrobacterales bacterium]|nr:DUF2914 domain-containing protein [Acidiferrobacterales bacterium]